MPQDNVNVYSKQNEDDNVMGVINNNPEAQELDLDRYAEGLKDSTFGTNVLSGEKIELGETLQVRGKTPLVLEFQ